MTHASHRYISSLSVASVFASYGKHSLVAVNIDHQFGSQYPEPQFCDGLKEYNQDYEAGLAILRAAHIPMIHVGFDYQYFYELAPCKVRLATDEKLKSFYHNQNDFTVRAAIGKKQPDEIEIKTEILHSIQDGDILLFKEDPSVHSNPQFDYVMQKNGWSVPLYSGQYAQQCVYRSMSDSANKYHVIGISNMIEDYNATPGGRQGRMNKMKSYFAKNFTMSDMDEVAHLLKAMPT